MKNPKILGFVCLFAAFIFLTGLRPKMEESTDVDTLVGTITMPEGYSKQNASGGLVKLSNEAGITIVVDGLSAQSVSEGSYTSDSVKPILAKSLEPKVVKDPEGEGDGAIIFRGFGTADGTSVAFVMSMIDAPKGAGMVLVYGPNSQREAMQAIAELVIVDLLE